METSKAYDLPIRIFHGSFALLFLVSFFIGKFVEDDSALYAYHMISGILMTILVIMRLFWSIFGSKTSSLSSFQLGLVDLKDYFSSLFSSLKTRRYLGHNPASSYAAILMMLFTMGIALSGSMMVLKINKHFFKEMHEVLAHLFFLVVILHIAGVIIHELKHRDGMLFSMINGKKMKIEGETEIESYHSTSGFVFVLLTVGIAGLLLKSYDTNSKSLSLWGNKIQLLENEKHEHHQRKRGHHEDEE